jgi:hypothetical protein
MVPKPLKSDPWAVLEGFGDPSGAKRAPRHQTMRQNRILKNFGYAWGSKMEPKSEKQVYMFCFVFECDFGTDFFDFGLIFE